MDQAREFQGSVVGGGRWHGDATGGRRSAARLARAALAGCLLAAVAAPAAAGVVEARVERPGIQSDTRLYVPFYAFFTADSDEALVTLSRPADDCASTEPCTSGSQCASGVCRSGFCRYPESVQVGYVVVLRKSKFCDIAACAPPGSLPAECTSGTCDGGSCASPSSNVNGLCLCSTCTETDPVLPASDAPFTDTFADLVDPRWVLLHASFASDGSRSYVKFLKPDYPDPNFPPASPWVGQAQIRIFGLLPGEEYVLLLKWTYAPYPGSVPCPLDAAITVHLKTVASVCAP